MRTIQLAFEKLYPGKQFNFKASLKYSRAFSSYNANVRHAKNSLHFRLSHNWKGVSEEIQIGLIQTLLNKIFRTKVRTTNIDLYNMYLKNIHVGIEKTNIDPILKQSFDRVNDRYFAGMLEMPNLVIGNKNFSKLGTYDYGSDTITISSLMLKDDNLLDYIMYHECLHKKLKFSHKTQRSLHHSKEFKERERQYEDKDVEKKLQLFLASQKRRSWFGF